MTETTPKSVTLRTANGDSLKVSMAGKKFVFKDGVCECDPKDAEILVGYNPARPILDKGGRVINPPRWNSRVRPPKPR